MLKMHLALTIRPFFQSISRNIFRWPLWVHC